MSSRRALRILFAGTPEFAALPLRAMLTEGFAPLAVFTQPDRPAGRGREVQASPVKQIALAAGIPVHQPVSLKEPAVAGQVADLIAGLQPDLMIVVAYGLILPARILGIPRLGCWNIHASLLPRWRGAAPIQRAIEAGDAETGVCIMQMDAGLDTGPVLHRAGTALDGSETAGSLHDRLAQLGADSLLLCLRRLAAGEQLAAVPQPPTGATYARKLDKGEAEIDWSQAAEVLEHYQWGEEADPQQLAGELADVTLYLLQLAYLTGIDLEQAILDKLERNYHRKWDQNASISPG